MPLLGALVVLQGACGEGVPVSAPPDAGRDGGVAARDAGGLDAGAPMRADAGAPVLDDAGAPGVDAGAPPSPETFAESWQRASIYLLMVDRFANGNPDSFPGDECYNPSHPRRYHGGDFDGLRGRLDYLQELGIDTIWVTPLTRQIGRYFDECGFHGYWTDMQVPDDGAVEPRLGTEEDLHELIDEMHARDMRLILDMVVNHPGYMAPITRSHPEWFHPREGCERVGDPVETCQLARLPDFNQNVPEAAEFITAHSLSWLRRFDVDGIRMDTVKHVPLAYFRDRWIPAVRDLGRDHYLLGEVFDESPIESQQRYLDAGFDGLFDFRLRRALVDGLGKDGSLDDAAQRVAEAYRTLGPERARLRSTFMENHDVPRYPSEVRAPNESIAIARMHLSLAVLMTTPGIPQLYQGTELGMVGAWPENRRDMPAWAWDASTRTPHEGYLGDPGQTFAVTRDLLALRRDIDALHAGDYVELWRPGGSGVPLYAFSRVDGDSRVLVTLSTGPVRQRVPLQGNPNLDDATKAAYVDGVELVDRLGATPGARATVVDGTLELELAPYTMAVWTVSE